MAWKKEPPQKTGWYWAKHKHYGKVITQIQMIEGQVHVLSDGFHGWNPLKGLTKDLYPEWDHTPIPEPLD